MARRVGHQLRHASGTDPRPAADQDRRHPEGRERQGKDLVHADPHRPRPAAGFLMTRKQSRSSRGVALVLVLTTVAILTSIGVDFSYSSRVSLKLAENLRDETRAYYMARSAVNLSRLLLHFQKQVDALGGQLTGAIQGMLNKNQPAQKPLPGAP